MTDTSPADHVVRIEVAEGPNLAERAVRILYPAFEDADVIYAATCCNRISLCRAPQTRCRTCPTIPTVTPIRSEAELVAWARTIPDPPTA